ncbi:MAG: Gfo/Idh/MocA family oxidoreductase [Verrucomicrobiaceae bacterium]|nr:MAG: Gfo/Idh/MocA family oxidoreductase [Verrucomicrobiaceae bacterium]
MATSGNCPRVAQLGCGYWGKNLARNFAELGALAAVCDPDPATAQREAEKNGVAARSISEVLADASIAGVSIAAPAEVHAELALKAFDAGKHVFVEKPIALTMEDAEKMRVAADNAGRALMVGHLLQYHPAFETLLGLVRNGELGKLRYAYSNRLSLGKFRTEENALWSFAPHDVSMLLALFGGEPVSVVGSGGAFVTPNIEDEFRLDMTFKDGGRAHVFASWLHPFKEHRLVVVGEKAMAVFEDSLAGPDKLRLYRHSIDTSGRAPEPKKAEAEHIAYPAAEPLKNECAHFLACCEGKIRPRTDAAEAIAVLKVLKAAG